MQKVQLKKLKNGITVIATAEKQYNWLKYWSPQVIAIIMILLMPWICKLSLGLFGFSIYDSYFQWVINL